MPKRARKSVLTSELNAVEVPAMSAMPMCNVAAEAPRPDPAFEKCHEMKGEARRALLRFAAFAATNDQTYYLRQAADALKALDY